jgi:hypothetical protein
MSYTGERHLAPPCFRVSARKYSMRRGRAKPESKIIRFTHSREYSAKRATAAYEALSNINFYFKIRNANAYVTIAGETLGRIAQLLHLKKVLDYTAKERQIAAI